MTRAFAIGSTVLLVILIAVFIGFQRNSDQIARLWGRSLDGRSVLREVQQLKQLVTVRYGIQRVVGLREAKQPFGEESILLMVEGQVLAGVDLGVLKQEDVHLLPNNRVHIDLPPAKIFDAYLDEKQTKIWDRQITWWTPWLIADPQLEHRARLKAVEEVRSAARDMGIQQEAQHQAINAIGGFLSTVGLKLEVGS